MKKENAGFNAKKLSKLAVVSRSLIAKLESGKIEPSHAKVKAIFDVLEQLEIKTEVRAQQILHNKVIGVQKAIQSLKPCG